MKADKFALDIYHHFPPSEWKCSPLSACVPKIDGGGSIKATVSRRAARQVTGRGWLWLATFPPLALPLGRVLRSQFHALAFAQTFRYLYAQVVKFSRWTTSLFMYRNSITLHPGRRWLVFFIGRSVRAYFRIIFRAWNVTYKLGLRSLKNL